MRDLCLIALVLSTIFVINSVCTEIVLGTFRPLPRTIASPALSIPTPRRPIADHGLVGVLPGEPAQTSENVPVVALRGRLCLTVLTKSRAGCGTFLVGLLVYWSFDASWRNRIMAGTVILSIGCAVALTASLLARISTVRPPMPP